MIKNQNQKIAYGFATMALTIVAVCYAFFRRQIVPFGPNSPFVSDLASQYQAYLVFFRNASPLELLFSFQKGFGGQTLGLVSYYTFSVFNFVYKLFPIEKAELAFFVVCLLRYACMSLCMYIYLADHFDNRLYNMVFGIMYGVYPYFMLYYYNVLWMDCYGLLPLLALGTEKIVYKKDNKLFRIVLIYMLLSNYYITYMAAVFIVLWFIYLNFVRDDSSVHNFINSLADMAHNAVFCVLVTAPVLLPSLFGLINGKLNDASIKKMGHTIYGKSIWPTLLFDQVWMYEKLPNFTSCLRCIFLLVTFIVSSKTIKKEKIGLLIVLCTCTVGILFSDISYYWTCFSSPMGFPFRQMFAYAFVFVLICRKSIELIEPIAMYKTFALMILMYAYGFYYYRKYNYLPWDVSGLKFTILSLVVTTIIYIAISYINQKFIIVLSIYLALITVQQCAFFTVHGSFAREYDNMDIWQPGQFSQNYIDTTAALDAMSKDGFYRVEDLTFWNPNHTMTGGYNGVSHYSSVFDQAQKDAIIHFGYTDTYYSTEYVYSRLLPDCLFGIKYIMANSIDDVQPVYQEIKTAGKTVYENPYSFPVFYTGMTNEVQYSDDYQQHINNMSIALYGSPLIEGDQVDYCVLQNVADFLNNNSASIVKNDGAVIKLKTDKPDSAYLLTSVIYDTAWHIKVNGRKVQPEKYMEHFISVQLEPGVENQIDMIYIPRGLAPGIAIMAAAILAEIAYAKIKKRT